jgi:hypothetical protein
MKFKNLKELRQPKSIPKILNQDFPQLTASCQTEIHVTQLQKETVATKDTTNLQDMAKFLMDSWQDEVGDEGQFDDASVQTSLSKGDNSDRITDDEKRETLKNNTELKDDPTVEEKTEEYFNRLTNEVDKIDLDDFENIQVSGISDLESEKQEDKSVKSSKMKSINSNCSSIDVEYDSYSDNSIDYDLSDDTSVSFFTESLLPYDKSSVHNRNSDSDSDNVPNARFDLTLPAQVNICSNAITTSSHEENDSTLSITNTESESKRTSLTSEKDESENNEAWTKLIRKEKKKMRDALRAKTWHDRYPEKEKQSTDTDSLEVIKCQNNKSISNTSKINGTLDVIDCHRWKLEGKSVIQIDGLPVNCDISALQDLIASYGTVFDSEKKIRSQSSSVRFR